MLVSPVLAGLAVAIGVPILLFYVYGVVPGNLRKMLMVFMLLYDFILTFSIVSLCRAGCGVSTSRDGVKFDFDQDDVGRNHDNQSVDAVSRIGATSIGEVSLSVASGSHLGVGSGANGPTRESTTALAGSINYSHKLEVQADVSETASAVTCVSEKSGPSAHDTASTRALAGSILNYRQMAGEPSMTASEDGTSERVRFDNIIYVMEGQKDGDYYTATLDQVEKLLINLFFQDC